MATILNWYQSGAFIIPLILIDIAGLGVLIDRFVLIVLGSKVNARPFMERVVSLVRAGKTEEALKLCADHQSALPDLGLVLLRSRSRDEAELLNIARAALLTATHPLTRRLSWLPALAKSALLVGALGSLAILYQGWSSAAGSASSSPMLARAVPPVGVGLFTAIPLLLGHTYLNNESQKTLARLQEFSARLVNALLDRPDVRLGHRSDKRS